MSKPVQEKKRNPKLLIAAALCFALAIAGACLLVFINSAVGAEPQTPAKVCGDVNGDADITASDALRVLVKAVGIDVEMRCNNRRNYKDEIGCIPNAPCTVLVPPELFPN